MHMFQNWLKLGKAVGDMGFQVRVSGWVRYGRGSRLQNSRAAISCRGRGWSVVRGSHGGGGHRAQERPNQSQKCRQGALGWSMTPGGGGRWHQAQGHRDDAEFRGRGRRGGVRCRCGGDMGSGEPRRVEPIRCGGRKQQERTCSDAGSYRTGPD